MRQFPNFWFERKTCLCSCRAPSKGPGESAPAHGHYAGDAAATEAAGQSVLRGPPSTPSQSPIGRVGQRPVTPPEAQPSGHVSTAGLETSVVGDFFSDELRGYRLIKGAR